MQLPHSRESAPRARRWRATLVGALAVGAVTGALVLGLPGHHHVYAQQKSDARFPSFADIVDRVKPAVVSIQISSGGNVGVASKPKGTPDPRGGGPNFGERGDPRGDPRNDPRQDPRGDRFGSPFPDNNPFNDFFRNLPGGPPRPPSQSQGSGFVISADGYVVTNNHVVENANKIQVIFDQYNKYEAELIGTDQRTDLALLKIKNANGKTFPFIQFSNNVPRVGEWVIAVGNPFGLGGTVTAGIVSAHGRDIGSGPYDYMQIDAAVNKGNSGGPTFNLDGEVVGVNTAIFSPSGGNVGIAFAIPAKTASDVIAQLKTSGSVKRGWLGVRIQSVDEDTAASLGLTETKGALVSEVTAAGPAANSGLKAGDTILSVNGNKVADSRDLARQIANYAPGTKVDIRVLRQQREQTISVQLGQMPSNLELAKAGPPGRGDPNQPTEFEQLGITVAPNTAANREGVLITDVDPNSDAATKGLRTGDIVLEMSGTVVNTPDDVVKAIREVNRLQRRAVLMRIRSNNETRFVAVQLKRN